MKVTRSSINTMAGPPEWFTGAVYVDAVATPTAPSRLSASSVHFTPGARTAWHTHPNGQTIFVTEGVGLAQRRGGPVEVSRPGDRVFFEPGEDHWHGAAPTRFMTHIAMLDVDAKSNSATWADHISDAEYAPAPSIAEGFRGARHREGRLRRRAIHLLRRYVRELPGGGPFAVHQWRRIRQPRHRWRPGRGGSMVGIVGVPHGVDASMADTIVFRNVGLRGGVAPARAYIPELLDDVLEGRINPGRVFDFETDLDHVADAYKAMDERRAIKSLIRIETKETGP